MRWCCTGGAPGPWEQGYLKGCTYAQSDPHTRKVHIVLWSKTEDNKAQDMNIVWQRMLLRSCSGVWWWSLFLTPKWHDIVTLLLPSFCFTLFVSLVASASLVLLGVACWLPFTSPSDSTSLSFTSLCLALCFHFVGSGMRSADPGMKQWDHWHHCTTGDKLHSKMWWKLVCSFVSQIHQLRADTARLVTCQK